MWSLASSCRHLSVRRSAFLVATHRNLAPPTFNARMRTSVPRSMGTKLDMSEVEEEFVKGSGPGGQKINKVRSCVVLTHQPTGIQVRCQDSRSLEVNRGKARKRLQLKVEHFLTPETSKMGKKIAKLQNKKRKAKARSKKNHGADRGAGTSANETENSPENVDDGSWTCVQCTIVNTGQSTECYICGAQPP